MKLNFLVIFIILHLASCNFSNQQPNSDYTLSSVDDSPWFHKSIELDTIPGIALDRAYNELISESEGEEVIIAFLDKQIEITHEDLKKQIFINPNEIPHNNIDDDNNGYIDDIHGWNFLGYGEYETEPNFSYEHVRVINKFKDCFQNLAKKDVSSSDSLNYIYYTRALAKHKEVEEDTQMYFDYDKSDREKFTAFVKTFSDQIPGHHDFTNEQLNNLVTENKEEEELVKWMRESISYGYTFDYVYEFQNVLLREGYTLNNLNYNDRALIGDDSNEVNSTNYGNNNVEAFGGIWHGTQVAGVAAATRNNGYGVQGVTNNIKIMSLVISPQFGSYKDKDLANAIRYAVDNGAKIINFSGMQEYYTENEELLFSALTYADNNGVLLIAAAGNDSRVIDLDENRYFFNDSFNKQNSVGNLIMVGGSTKDPKDILYNLSNYSKTEVDLFAPSYEMTTTNIQPVKYRESQGTSLGTALTSGVAALVMSHYPNLTHHQVKQILMDSGTEIDAMVKTTDSVAFKDLSKSGKIINAYNALKMAAELSK